MVKLTPQQRLQIVQLYYENQCSVRNVFRAIRETYGAHNRPTETTIANTIRKFESQFTLLDDTRPVRPHPARSKEIIAAVAESVREHRDESIRRRSKQLGLSYSTIRRILREDIAIEDAKEEVGNDEASEEKTQNADPEKRTQQHKRKANDVDILEEPTSAPKKASKTKTKAAKKETVDSAGVPEDPAAKLSPVLTEIEPNGNKKSISNKERTASKVEEPVSQADEEVPAVPPAAKK